MKEIELHNENGMRTTAKIKKYVTTFNDYDTEWSTIEPCSSVSILNKDIVKVFWELTKQGWKDQDWLKGDEG